MSKPSPEDVDFGIEREDSLDRYSVCTDFEYPSVERWQFVNCRFENNTDNMSEPPEQRGWIKRWLRKLKWSWER